MRAGLWSVSGEEARSDECGAIECRRRWCIHGLEESNIVSIRPHGPGAKARWMSRIV